MFLDFLANAPTFMAEPWFAILGTRLASSARPG